MGAGSITAYIGDNGFGKSLAGMVLEVIPTLAAGREVWSTMQIFDERAHVLQSWSQIPRIHDSLLFLDEISRILPARGAMSAPQELIMRVQSMRKDDVDVAWTAPNWSNADKVLRGVTQRVTVCKGFVSDPWQRTKDIPPWFKPFPPKLRDAEGFTLRRKERWPSFCLFHWITYDATAFDEFTTHAIKDVKPLSKVWYWAPWFDTRWMYDTLEEVSLMDAVNDVGVCIQCQGVKRRKVCHCGDIALSQFAVPAPTVEALAKNFGERSHVEE